MPARLTGKLRLYVHRPGLLLVLVVELGWRLLERVVRPDRVTCPICGWTGWRFRAFADEDGLTKDSLCDNCRMGSRERALYVFLETSGRLRAGLRCIDVGPRLPYEALFRGRGCTLFFVDLVARDVDAQMDVTGLALRRESVDLVICYHVLEHVPRDDAALRELCRVLKPSGEILIQVPLEQGQTVTREYPPREFSPKDHVRDYGADIVDRIAAAGFEVISRDDADGLTAAERERLGIHRATTFVCRHAAR